MSNTRFDRLASASTDANGHFHICADCHQRVRTNRDLNQRLISCYLKNKITNVQALHERNKDDENDQTPKDSNIEIPDISTPSLPYRAIIKIICLREIYLSLTKKIVYWQKNLFCYYLDKQERISLVKRPD